MRGTIRRRRARPTRPDWNASGTVVAVDQAVTGIREGDRVCALLTGRRLCRICGGFRALHLAGAQGVTLEDAGGLPEVYFTVWSNVFDTARLKPGETFLVHGGSSGIGTAAIQLMHARGHRVFTTAGSPEKCAACVKLGATRAINYRTEDFVALVKAETNGRGVDVILDMVGGDYVMRNLNALARGGRVVNIAYQKGAKVEVDFRIVQARLLTLGRDRFARPARFGKSADPRPPGEGSLAAVRNGPAEARHLSHVPARAGRNRTPDHAGKQPYREDSARPPDFDLHGRGFPAKKGAFLERMFLESGVGSEQPHTKGKIACPTNP